MNINLDFIVRVIVKVVQWVIRALSRKTLLSSPCAARNY